MFEVGSSASITVVDNKISRYDTLDVTINNASIRDDAWVGLYKVDETPGVVYSIWWRYLSQLGVNNGNGSFTLNLSSIENDRLVYGNKYKLVLFEDDIGGYPIDASVEFDILIPSIIISNNKVTLDKPMQVDISNGSNKEDAWVGLYEMNITPGDKPSIWHKRLNELGVNNGNGRFSLDLASITNERIKVKNQYKLILFEHDQGGYPMNASTDFNLQAPSITILNDLVTYGDELQVTISNGSTRHDAWVGIYELETTPGDKVSIWWRPLEELGVYNGNGQFTLDLSSITNDRFKYSNRYKIVLFRNDLGYLIDASETFTVLDEIAQGQDAINFLAISDIHVCNEDARNKFKKVFTKTNEMMPDLDGILIAGDFTDQGKESEYNDVMSIYSQYANKDAMKLWVMGNHDYWNGLSAKDAQKRFIEKTKEKLHSHKVIKGIHFIQLSTEAGDTHGVFGNWLKKWLREQLEIAQQDDSNRPIFVTCHQHVKPTVYGSHDWGNVALYDVLADYPQVVSFSGHSHFVINDERSIHQKDFTAVGTAGTLYFELERGKIQGSVPNDAYEFSQGLLVNVDTNNKITLKRIDFYNDRIIKDDWVIESPSDKTKYRYTDARIAASNNPYFDSNADIQAWYTDTDAIKVRFSQAKDEDMVQSYRIELVNIDTGEIDKSCLAFSEFYKYPMPDRLAFEIDGLTRGTRYKVQITAIDSFGKESLDKLSVQVNRPSLTLSKNQVNIDESIEVSLLDGRKPPKDADWIGLYEDNETPDGNPRSIWWNTAFNLGITANEGSFTFNPSMIGNDTKHRYTSGKKYKFIYAYDDTYNIESSVSFTVK